MTTGTTQPPTVPPARALRREVRLRRRSHAEMTLWTLVETGYTYGLFALVFGSMAGAATVRAWRAVAACDAACAVGRETLPPILILTAAVLALRMLLAIGPLVAGAATATWLFATPVDRRELLRPRAIGLALAGAGIGAALSASTLGLSTGDGIRSASGGLAGAMLGAFLVALAVYAQERGGLARRIILACDVAFIAALLAMPALLALPIAPGTGWSRLSGLLVAAAIAAIATLAVGVPAERRLGSMPRRVLHANADLVAGMSGAALSMDSAMFADMLHHRRFQRLGARRSRRGRGAGLVAVAVREAARPLRSPMRLLVAAATAAIPYMAEALGAASAVPIVAAVIGYLALRHIGNGLGAWARSPGLRRALPYGDLAARLAYAVAPIAAAGLWSLAVLPTIGAPSIVSALAVWVGLTATIGAAIVRSSTKPPVGFDGAFISTPAGVLPAGLVRGVARGPDALVISALAFALGVPAALVLVLAYALWRT